ncbi:MAG TPA: hypothetical protein VGO00_15320, partial [Kofleriaceae bacterium]|nr:hypothetical protein [Kofleriaceae bacterium]
MGAIRERFVPMVATYELTYVDTPAIGMEPAKHKPHVDLRKPRGLFARYICSGCGAVELVCEEPEAIPIGPEHMTDVVDVAAAGPYR